MIRRIMRKLFLIHAAITPIELLLPIPTGMGGRRPRWLSGPFAVRFADQQLQASLLGSAPCPETNLKPLKLLYG